MKCIFDVCVFEGVGLDFLAVQTDTAKGINGYYVELYSTMSPILIVSQNNFK